MRKVITRTITTSTIKSLIFEIKEGKPVLTANAPLQVNGSISNDKALNEARKIYGQNAQLEEVIEKVDTYEISVEDFMKYATKVEPKETTPEPQK